MFHHDSEINNLLINSIFENLGSYKLTSDALHLIFINIKHILTTDLY